jgi:ribosomal protein S8E
MAIDFSTVVYLQCQDTFGREITITPVVSQPNGAAYTARGILTTRGTAIQTDAGMVVMSDQETILDIREREFSVVPMQGDQVDVPVENGITDMVGSYEITDAAWNGGGEVTLTIRRYG